MKTVLLAIRPDRYAQLTSEIALWKSDRIAEGWAVNIHQTATASGYDLRAEFAQLPSFDHVLLIGALPCIFIYSGPDGHYLRWVHCPSYLVNRNVSIDNARVPGTDDCQLPDVIGVQAYAGVGWLNFDGLIGDQWGVQGLTDDEQTEQYRLWFARRHALNFSAFPIVSRLNDHFNYNTPQTGDYTVFGKAVDHEHAKYPKSLYHFTPTYLGEWDDGELRAQTPCLFNHVMSGGFDYQALYNYGYWWDLESCPIQAPIASWWGSSMVNFSDPRCLVRWALVDRTPNPTKCKVVASIYNQEGKFSFSTFLNGGTLGEAATATKNAVGYGYAFVHGDPTIRFDAATLQRLADNETGSTGDDLTMSQYTELLSMINANTVQISSNTGRIVTLETSSAAMAADIAELQGTTQPPPPALAWNLGGPDTGTWKAATAVGGQRYDTPVPVAVGSVDVPAAVVATGWTGTAFSLTVSGIPSGSYTLDLFGEDSWQGAGKRLQDFMVNGTLLFTGVDWAALAGGMNKAASVSKAVVIPASGVLTISAVSKGPVDFNTWLCGFRLRS